MADRPNYALRWLALGLIAFGVFRGTGGKLPIPIPGPGPAPAPVGPTIPAPSADLQRVVAPLTAKVQGDPVAAELAGFLAALADAVEADVDGLVKNNAQVRKAVSAGIQFAFPKNRPAGPSGTAKLLDETLLGLLGNDPAAFDRPRAAAALRAMAWACQEGAR